MPFIIGTNEDYGSEFLAGYEEERWEFHTEYTPIWSQDPTEAIKFRDWIGADLARSRFVNVTGDTETKLHIWEHP